MSPVPRNLSELVQQVVDFLFRHDARKRFGQLRSCRVDRRIFHDCFFAAEEFKEGAHGRKLARDRGLLVFLFKKKSKEASDAERVD